MMKMKEPPSGEQYKLVSYQRNKKLEFKDLSNDKYFTVPARIAASDAEFLAECDSKSAKLVRYLVGDLPIDSLV